MIKILFCFSLMLGNISCLKVRVYKIFGKIQENNKNKIMVVIGEKKGRLFGVNNMIFIYKINLEFIVFNVYGYYLKDKVECV